MPTLGPQNDNLNIDGAETTFVDFGGNDTYTILPNLSADVTITDNQASTINLPEGLEIADARFSANGVQFTVNGFTVTFIGDPASFSFVFGGTPINPAAGVAKTFADTAAAFGTSIPAPGSPPNTATKTGPVTETGIGPDTSDPTPEPGPTPEPDPTLALAADAPSVDEGDTASFTIETTNVATGSTVTYVIGGNAAGSVSGEDITGDVTGTAIVGEGGKATISVAIKNDDVTEGPETLTLTATLGDLSATANTIINDTSKSPEGLTTADDTLAGSAGDDAFTGVSSALSSERTLNLNDKIDGGAGNDSLSVDMKVDFLGFSSTGFLKNVENVNLTNTGTVGRVFDASGVTGAQTYKLSGDVSLRDLDSATTGVTIENRDSGSVSIGYANDVIKGTSDTLALGVNGLGTAEVPASTGVTGSSEKKVEINATSNTGSIETAAITASGTNVISLGGNVGTLAITVAGAGSVAIRDVAAGLKTFDASQATGNVVVDFAGTTGVTSAKGGSGSDGFTVRKDDLTVNATVEGGSGADALQLTGAFDDGSKAANPTPLQLAMSGVETIALNGALGLIFSGVNTSGVEKISVTGDSTVSFSSLGSSNITYDLKGATADGVISSDNSGTATVTVDMPAADADNDAKATVNKTSLSLTKASQVDLTVGDKMDYQGKITASEATTVTAAIVGQTTGAAAIKADKAQSVVISEVTGGDSALEVTAGVATSVQVSNAKGLNLDGSTFSKVETFSSNGAGAITTGNLGAASKIAVENTGAVNIGAIGSDKQDYTANITVSGAGKTDIGTVATQSQAVTITANNLTGDFQVASIAAGSGDVNVTAQTNGAATLGATAGKNVTVNFTDVFGAVMATGITASNVSVAGSSIANNTIKGTADTVIFTGGILKDALTLVGNSGVAGGKVTNTLNITTDLGDDTIEYTTKDAAGLQTTLTGTVNLGSGTDSLVLSVGGTQAASLNAAGLMVTGAETITINGNVAADTLVGTAGDDVINPSGVAGGPVNGRDVMAGLGGKDTINATDASVDEIHFRSVDGSDTITGFSFTEDKIHFLDNANLTGGSVDFAGFADTTEGAAGTDFAAAQETAGLYVEVDNVTQFGAAGAVNGAVFAINADNVNGATITTTNAVLNSYVLVDAGANLEVYFDSDWTDNAGREKVMTLVGVADTSQVDVTDFGIYTTV